MPPSNALVSPADLAEEEARYELDFALCQSCGLAQITVSLDPDELFGEYAYFSGYSETMLAHAEALSSQLVAQRELTVDSLVVEVASNDGYLLQFYVAAGVPVLGIDPAENVVAAARERGVETICEFFGKEVAQRLRASGLRADVIHANNVLAHVPDVNGFVQGIQTLLAIGGVAVIETPYVRDLVERLEFDTIYHEHLFYYSLTSLSRLFARNGLKVVDVERIPIHGGSLRVFAARVDDPVTVTAHVTALLAEEEEIGIARLAYFEGFAEQVDELRRRLPALLDTLLANGHHIAAYGAAAKGSVLLNTCRIGRDRVSFVADRNIYKQGRYMPGVRIPIVAPERLLEEMPDEVLLLAWNLADEIVEQQSEYRARGGRFIVPLPEPRIV